MTDKPTDSAAAAPLDVDGHDTSDADDLAALLEGVPEDVAADLRAASANMAAERERLRRRLRNRKLWRIAMLLATAVMIAFVPVAFLALNNAEARADRWVSETSRILDDRYLETVEYVRTNDGSKLYVEGIERTDCAVLWSDDVPALECDTNAPTQSVEWLPEPVILD